MLNSLKRALTMLAVLLVAATAGAQQPQGTPARRPDAIPSIADRTPGMKKLDGFFPLYWDDAGGRLFV